MMTPAREAEIRRTVERIKAQAASGAWMSEGYHDQQDLLAEIDRLRALPVIATCGECRHRSSLLCDHPGASGAEDRSGPITRVSYRVESSAAPPAWCPLRGGR